MTDNSAAGTPPQTTPDSGKQPPAKSAKPFAQKPAADPGSIPATPTAPDKIPASKDATASQDVPTDNLSKPAPASVKVATRSTSTTADATTSAQSSSTPAADPTSTAPHDHRRAEAAEIAATLAKATAPTTDTSPHSGATTTASPLTTTATIPPRTATADRATTASAAQTSPATDDGQTFDQVVLGLRGKIDARNGKAEIRLDPPNLGTVRVSVSLDKGTLTAQFQSSSDSVRDLLKSNMEKLKSVLESQGVSVDRLSVDSPAVKTAAAPDASSDQAGANNNGRSAGQYQQNASDQRRSQKDSSAFSRVWREATQDAAPMDVVA